MSIPESQLEIWSHLGSVVQSSYTYNTVKNVLESTATNYSSKNFKIFLQGSYGNNTNIYSESDVDIVIRLDDCFQSDLMLLSEEEKNSYKSAFSNATYTGVEFKRDVLSELVNQYGDAVRAGDKAISIDAYGSRRKADVIVAIQFRRYFKFNSSNDSEYIQGICFLNGNGELIANYPKQHSSNLTKKHQETSGLFKPVVRILKNMRSKMIDDGLIEEGVAPSYFIEGLLYNVPNEKFTSNYQYCIQNVLNWYLQQASKSELVCANEQHYLLRNEQLVCWSPDNCDAFISAAVRLWNEW